MCMGIKASGKAVDEWRAEDDHRTMQRAEEVRSDPSRMKKVATFHRKKLGEMKRVGQQLGATSALADPSRKAPKRRAPMARPSGRR